MFTAICRVGTGNWCSAEIDLESDMRRTDRSTSPLVTWRPTTRITTASVPIPPMNLAGPAYPESPFSAKGPHPPQVPELLLKLSPEINSPNSVRHCPLSQPSYVVSYLCNCTDGLRHRVPEGLIHSCTYGQMHMCIFMHLDIAPEPGGSPCP